MTSRKAVDSLQDILEAIAAIERFTTEVDFEQRSIAALDVKSSERLRAFIKMKKKYLL
ncbi:hypothetical protein [Myxosarcina sp. GI1(2024)]